MWGSFDLCDRVDLRETLKEAIAFETAIVDVTHALYLDSSTIGVLVALHVRRSILRATKLKVVGITAGLRGVFELSSLDGIFDLEGRGRR
ncbi:MAG: STAS domain-containing protein [Vulcanimicrobiaceae bacterium]